ncbi:ABC transporter substrate-binding protein [Paenibacillus thermotolerans]|uniref:ABC transporter substrate-binding protein n=1 Tax=Paenibacillus thermotolerans TaxID=3027807 RepID=UPI0023685617|nr:MULTISPECIES: sugar ABC transporter substrate-binding protein [unclassified Paenibacillus]
MFKKNALFLLCLILVLGSLIGCAKTPESADSEPPATQDSKAADSGTDSESTKTEPPKEVTKIKFSGWGDPEEKAVFEKLIKDFEAKNADIDVEYLHIPADYVGKMNTVLAGGNAPDVFYVPDGDFGRWVSTGVLMNIQSYVDASSIDLNDIWESALGRYKYDGKNLGRGDLYALPKDIGPTVLYYNKKLFDEAKVPYPSPDTPMTWDELLGLAAKLTKDDNGDGKPEQYGMGPIWWEGFVWGNGGEVLNADRTEFVLNSKEGTDALQFAADIRNKHRVAPDSRALQAMNDGQMFETGKLAMIIQGRWMVPAYRKLDFDWDVAPLPTKQWAGWSGSVGFGIYAKSKNPEAAHRLVEYLAGPEGQKLQSELGFAIPNFKSMANTDVFLQPGQKPEHAEVFIKAAEAERPGPWTYVPNNKWWDVLNQNLGQLWDGKKSAQDLMNELKPEIDKALKEGNPHLFE